MGASNRYYHYSVDSNQFYVLLNKLNIHILVDIKDSDIKEIIIYLGKGDVYIHT